MRHGQGTLTYATGEVYEGEWVNDRKGVCCSPVVVIASIPCLSSLRVLTMLSTEGQGTMKHTNGTVYVGQWKDGLRSGHVRGAPFAQAHHAQQAS
jgi:hypothetical protein